MKPTKKQLTNAAYIIFIVLFLFTPVGFYLKVYVSRLFSFSPTELSEEERKILNDYTWKLSGLEGDSFDFEGTRGRIVFVNFWATWCPPCVAEMPSLEELYKDYGDKVEFVFVAHDEKEKVSLYMYKKRYSFPVYFERTSSPDLLSPEYIPTTYVIDEKGEIVVQTTGAKNWNSNTTRQLLDKLLSEE
ncbi:hypothetical protein MNBD_BACTEROID03-1454 [hydrothermal vent metagenome]|uniref:Thioredoxin domain-containing protein n=1 Tax=hydrothermal vent metagenome TaxID=652676 RepID=A0A3B0T106_9ZZZZ